MSGSDVDRPDGETDKPPTPTSPDPPKADSLFKSDWSAAIGKPAAPVFAPPPTPSIEPPAEKVPSAVPRTSEGMSQVSGEIGKVGVPPKVEAPAKVEVPVKAEAPAKAEELTKDDEELEDEEPEDEAPDEAPPPSPPPSQQARAGSRGVMLILAIAAAVVLVVLYISSNKDDASNSQASRPNKTGSDSPKPAPRPPEVKTRSKTPPIVPPVEPEVKPDPEPEPVDTSDSTTETGDPEPNPEPNPEPEPRPKVENPRDPSLVPPETPAENAKAFSKLPVAPSDGPPIGGIGRTGIHLDRIAMAEGRDNNGCDEPTRNFSATGTEFINVCIRVIHPRSQETLRVFWEKDGAITRRGKVRIPEGQHAYKTRAYLQVRPEYVGSWRVRIVPEGEESIDLGAAEFVIAE